MKTITMILGFLMLAMGLLWCGQGLGYINWPASSFMIRQIEWTYYGMILSAIGLLIMWFSRSRAN